MLCHADAYLREFDANVVEITPSGVVLDRTAFYPGGGGQPADTGALRSADTEYPGHQDIQVGRQAGP